MIERERPDALLPTLGGQTGLNVAMDLDRHGVLEKYGVQMIGANAQVIAKAEERDQFKSAMEKIGLECCRGQTVHTIEQAREVLKGVGLALRRPSQLYAWWVRVRRSPTTARNSTRWCAAGSISRRSPKC